MYPGGEMTRLAAHKAALRGRIARRRRRCAGACTRLARPIALLDRLHALWRQVAPLARSLARPAALWFGRSALPPTGFWARALRWSPVIFAAWRGLAAAQRRPR
jgi:hypothetical protein